MRARCRMQSFICPARCLAICLGAEEKFEDEAQVEGEDSQVCAFAMIAPRALKLLPLICRPLPCLYLLEQDAYLQDIIVTKRMRADSQSVSQHEPQ